VTSFDTPDGVILSSLAAAEKAPRSMAQTNTRISVKSLTD
jgi:hypothetical protein